MVARMMKWRPWPPATTGRKVEVRLVVRRVEGGVEGLGEKVAVEVRWKGGRMGLGALRRRVKRNWTREEGVGDSGVVVWDEEFRSVCSLTVHKENAFQPWEIGFTVFSGLNQGPKKLSVIGTASLNLAEFVSAADVETEINLPLLLPDARPESHPTLNLTLSLLELRTFQEPEVMQRCVMPVTSSPPSGDSLPLEKDELSAFKAGLRKVKILSDFISTRKAKKTCRDDEGSEGKCSTRSEDGEYAYPFDSDSLDDDDDADEVEEGDSNFRKSFSYGTLASANFYGGPVYSDLSIKGDYEDWIPYSHRRSDVGLSNLDQATKPISDQPLGQTSKRSILNWKKRKLSFRSPKAKGEPLLKKGNGDEGGDDIDFDRRQLTSSDESYNGFKADDDGSGQRSSFSEFGDDNFVVGSWESKKFESRDGQMKLFTQVFFASIDQRSERAAGESACTALVAVIADWFQSNVDMMPIKSQFDSLIREGSLEWRNLCDNQIYRELFPDKHFDLETVLQAKIRPLSVNPGKSFIGFFRPEGTTDNNSGFDFLHGAMSFDSIWDEISQAGSDDCPANGNPQLYIVSWNDHFFVLKVERDAYYIIDTLGERLYEGCNQAYILKFDENTLIYKTQEEEKPASSEAGGADKHPATQENNTKCSTREDATNNGVIEEEIVFRGKEACREYIKSFLAAIPIRELQADINKGLRASTPLHHRLQIEFHYTEASKEIVPVTPMSVEPIPEPEAAVTFAQSANLEVEVV
ncbi:NT-type C2 domain-containing protein [Dioscorea alata]|uniref:NT-type C2 domain-containing protein n=1 Tax=Dioscorea alata TaxID=55571 RepID=A0ACB7UMN2_DIOAL|nr:NT-type C2 domain-containing protein [Dioscorea alata]